MCIMFLNKNKNKKQSLLLEKYEIIFYDKSSRILGLVLYTLLPKIIFEKGSIIPT